MKWFKHFSDASDDEMLESIIEEFGLEGYARWWLLLEAIARNMDETDKCSAEYSWVKWQQILRGKRSKINSFLKRFGNKLETNEKQNGNVLEIKCRKLLELRDNYTKNLQVTKHPACKQEVEEEVYKHNKRFVKPSVEEIREYCEGRNNGIDAQVFYDSNEAKGWVVGKLCTPMKDWKAVIRTWESNEKKYSKPKDAYNTQRNGYA